MITGKKQNKRKRKMNFSQMVYKEKRLQLLEEFSTMKTNINNYCRTKCSRKTQCSVLLWFAPTVERGRCPTAALLSMTRNSLYRPVPFSGLKTGRILRFYC